MKGLKILLLLTLFPLAAQEKWFSKGDMYGWRNKKVPLKILIQTDGLWKYKDCYDSLVVVRDDSVYEARKFKDGEEWFPKYKVDKSYLKRLSDDYLKAWLKRTNFWLSYLSGGKFQLKLEGIERVKEAELWKRLGKGYTMIIDPHGGIASGGGGWYFGQGIFSVNPLEVYFAEADSTVYSPTAIHEILHSLLGQGHSPDTLSTAYHRAEFIGLTEEEAAALGWPKVEPIRLKRSEL